MLPWLRSLSAAALGGGRLSHGPSKHARWVRRHCGSPRPLLDWRVLRRDAPPTSPPIPRPAASSRLSTPVHILWISGPATTHLGGQKWLWRPPELTVWEIDHRRR